MTVEDILPGISWWDPQYEGAMKSSHLVRPIQMGDDALYLAGRPSSDHQVGTRDVFLARSWDPGAIDVVKTTPGTDERPWDLLARPTTAYLLTSKKIGSGLGETFTITVWRANASLTGWRGLFTCPGQSTFARSFEESNGDFYLGLGTDDGQAPNAGLPDPSYTTGVKAASGQILRIPQTAYAP